jgi:hypothetical protein
MTSIVQAIFAFVLGLVLSLLGIVHSFSKYPGAKAFAAFIAGLPSLGSVLFFVLGIAAALAGLILLFTSVRRLRHRWHYLQRITSGRPNREIDEEQEYAGAYR